MGLLDRLSEGAEKVAKQAEKAFEQGKGKVEELQLERQLDGLARKVGYMEFDAHRNRQVDSSAREALLAEMVQVEDQLTQMREEARSSGEGDTSQGAPAATSAPTEAGGSATGPAETTPPPESTPPSEPTPPPETAD